MQLINNRYKIIERLNDSEEVSVYLCSDIWDSGKLLKVNIIQKNIMTHKLKKIYIENFIALNRIDNENIVKNTSFDRVREIDNRKTAQEQYLYTSEYVKTRVSLLEYIKDKNAFEVIDICLDICRAVHRLHINGYVYGRLNIENIFFSKEDSSFTLKLKDLASVKLEEEMFSKENIDLESINLFKSKQLDPGARRFDMYSLGILFVCMISRGKYSSSPGDILEDFRGGLSLGRAECLEDNEIETVAKVLGAVEKLLSLEREYPYRYVYEFINEINKELGREPFTVDIKKLEKLNIYNNLVGRKNEIRTVKNAYRDMLEYKENKNIFFIEGNSGTGKTRLLKELDFLLKLDGADVYSSFKLKKKDDDLEVLEEIFNSMIFSWQTGESHMLGEKLTAMNLNKVDFKSIGFKEALNDSSKRDKLLNKMSGYIIDNLKNKPSVIIIDNINLASEFTIDIIRYIYYEIVKDKNIILIFTYNYEEIDFNKKNIEFIADLRKRGESSVLKLENFSEEETGEFIKNILSMDHIPLALSKRIYDKSYGNPLFITEIIKELYSGGRLYKVERNGLWHVNLEREDREYKGLEIPNSIEQALLNQLKDITYKENMIINSISISFDPVGLEELDDLLGIERESLERGVADLLNKGVLTRAFKNRKDVYEINNKVLKDIIYEKIPEDTRRKSHKIAADLLEKKIRSDEKINLTELIFHLEKSDQKSKLKKYLIQNAKEKYKSRDLKGAVEDLEKAVSLIEREDTAMVIKILLKKLEMCIEIESVEDAVETLEKIESLNSSEEDLKISLKLKILKTEIALLTGDFSEMKDHLAKAEKLLEVTEDLESRLNFSAFKSIVLFKDGKADEAKKLCQETIERCGNIYIKIKGNSYRILALIYTGLNRLEEAIELNKKSIELLESIGYTRGVIYAANNIGIIYQDNYQDLGEALEYHQKTLRLSREYKIASGELLALSNIGAVLYDMNDFKGAYDFLKEALEKALQVGYKEEIIYIYRQLTLICMDKGDYSGAYKYYMLALENSQGDERLMDDLKLYKGEVYYNLGAFDKALKWTEEALENIGDRISVKYKYTIRTYLLKILTGRLKKNELEECIEKIIEASRNIQESKIKIKELSKTAEALYLKGDRLNACRIFEEMKRSASADIDDEGLGYYHYIKGMLSDGDNSINTLRTALRLAKKNKNKLLAANVKIEIGNYYYDKEDWYNSINYYVGAAQIIRNIVYDIPDRYKLSFVNNYSYVRFHYRLFNMMNMLLKSRKSLGKTEIKSGINSLEELSYLLSTDYNILADDKEFIDRYRENYIFVNKNKKFAAKNIVHELDNDLIGNLEKIIDYLSEITLATKAQVIIEEEEKLIVIAALSSENKRNPSAYVFERLKAYMKPILISTRMILNEYDASFLKGDLKAGIYIPITSGYSNLYISGDREIQSKNLRIIGYIYLETVNTINNFNEEVLKEHKGLVKLVSILCEKYKLIRMSTIDKLTGALTRKHLEDTISEISDRSKENQEEFSIIMYDLDRFKSVNDKFGHQTGDEVLKKVSAIVMENIEENCFLGRYGGEEFVVILPDTCAEDAFLISENLRKRIYNAKIMGDASPVSISSGVSSYPLHADTPDGLIAKADQALYSAKEKGRNRSEVWNKNISAGIKPISKLDGIITGDDIKNSRNMLALVETIEFMNSSADIEEKIKIYLTRLIETLDAQCGYLLIAEEGEISEVYKEKARTQEKEEQFSFNKTIAEDVIKNKKGVYTIDWNDVKKSSIAIGAPVWSSVLAVPVIKKGDIEAVIYLVASTNSKEFGMSDFNFANVYANLLHL